MERSPRRRPLGTGRGHAVSPRPRKGHVLKTWPDMFQAIVDGRKCHEFRKNDRDFAEGDILALREYEPAGDHYTGRSVSAVIGSISYGPEWGIPEGYAVFTLLAVTVAPSATVTR